MPELRWTLLILGVVFIVVLTWWERRRPHQASRQQPHIGSEPRPLGTNDPSWGPDIDAPNPRFGREPTLTLPEIRARDPVPTRDLPVVEIPDDSLDEAPPPAPASQEVVSDGGAAALAAVREAIGGTVKEAPKAASKMWPLEAPRETGVESPQMPEIRAKDTAGKVPTAPSNRESGLNLGARDAFA